MIIGMGFLERFVGIASFERLFERVATACGNAAQNREARTRPNEPRGKTFLFPLRAAEHFLKSAWAQVRIELSPAALEDGLPKFIFDASEKRVVEINTGGVT